MKTITMPKNEYDEMKKQLIELQEFKESKKVFSVCKCYYNFSKSNSVTTTYNSHIEAYKALEKVEYDKLCNIKKELEATNLHQLHQIAQLNNRTIWQYLFK